MKSATLLMFSALFFYNAQAETIVVPDQGAGNPPITILSAGNGAIADTGTISDAIISFDKVSGTGAFGLNASMGLTGGMHLHDTTVSANSDGSLAFDGLVTFDLFPSVDYHYFGNLVADYDYDDVSDVVVFTFSPIKALPGLSFKGFLMTDGPYAGYLMDFSISASLLAYVENPFPVYSPVPLPAALWLFVSGCALLGFSGTQYRRR